MTAIIERANDGTFGIYAQDENVPLMATGDTEGVAREDFEAFYHTQAEYMREKTGNYPDWYRESESFDYLYDLSGFFLAFPFINVTEFAKYVGINPSLMRKYKTGIAKAGPKQIQLIQSKLDSLVDKLNQVKL